MPFSGEKCLIAGIMQYLSECNFGDKQSVVINRLVQLVIIVNQSVSKTESARTGSGQLELLPFQQA